MTDEQLLKLAKIVEVQICGILIENKICNYIEKPSSSSNKKTHNNFNNLTILEPFKTQLGYEDLDSKYAQELKDTYPRGCGKKGTTSTIMKKFRKYLDNNPKYTAEHVIQAVSRYAADLEYQGKTYLLFNLNNIFYKNERGTVKSPIEDIMNKYFEDDVKHNTDDLKLDL